jgi:uncharacterized protein (DUF2249 family)
MAGLSDPTLIIDVRGFTPALRGPLITCVVDQLIEAEAQDTVMVILDSEPAGLGYQLEMRRETRGKVEFTYDQRHDGAWVAIIRPRPGRDD